MAFLGKLKYIYFKKTNRDKGILVACEEKQYKFAQGFPFFPSFLFVIDF